MTFKKQQQHSESYVLAFNKALDDARVASDDAKRASIEVPSLPPSLARSPLLLTKMKNPMLNPVLMPLPMLRMPILPPL